MSKETNNIKQDKFKEIIKKATYNGYEFKQYNSTGTHIESKVGFNDIDFDTIYLDDFTFSFWSKGKNKTLWSRCLERVIFDHNFCRAFFGDRPIELKDLKLTL